MKNLIISIVIIFTCVQLSAQIFNQTQFPLDSYKTQLLHRSADPNPDYNVPLSLTTEDKPTHLVDTRMIIRIESVLTDKRGPNVLSIFSYREDGAILTKLEQVKHYGTWTDRSLYTYSYDANASLSSILLQSCLGDTLTNSQRNVFVYDDLGRLKKLFFEVWELGAWQNTMKVEFTFDDKGNLISELLKGWYNNTWMNYLLYNYGYDENSNHVSSIRKKWQNNEWENELANNFNYDEAGNNTSTSIRIWTGTNWLKTHQYLYTYDSNSLWLTTLLQVWVTDHWVNMDSYANTYNSEGDRLTWLHQEWENESWVNSEKQEYSFNPGKVDAICYYWSNGNWGQGDQQDLSIYLQGDLIFSEKAYGLSLTYTDVTSVDDKPTEAENTIFHCYPNPSTDQINIQINPAWQANDFQVELFNQSGQRVKAVEISNPGRTEISFNVEGLPPGMYLLKVTSGQSSSTQKVIITK